MSLEALPIDVLDRMAFGVTQGEQRLALADIRIKYEDDYENAVDYVTKHPTDYEDALDVPVDVSLERGVYWLEDGHHRFVTAELRGDRDILVSLTIKDNPIRAIEARERSARTLTYVVDDSPEALRHIYSTLRREHGPDVVVPAKVAWRYVSGLYNWAVQFYAERYGVEIQAAEQDLRDGRPIPPVVLYDGNIFLGHSEIVAARNLGIEQVPVLECF
jgi:hypothetical protein